VVTLELEAGTGATASTFDIVTVSYTGWIYDPSKADNKGKVFDSSASSTPLTFQIGANEVIPGFDQGVTGMKVGGLRRVTIPPDQAYGAAGAGTAIPPNATLVFEIRLITVSSAALKNPVSLDLQVGTGTEATTGKVVGILYTAWLYDSTQVDNKGTQFLQQLTTPTSFTLGGGQVLLGLDQGIVGMKVGGTRRLTLPPQLAYGGSATTSVPAYSVVIFEVQLTSVS
jgi:peptidylprolyl isomerase